MPVNNSNSETWSWFQPPPRNQRQPLPPQPLVDTFVIQQLLRSHAYSMPYFEESVPKQHLYSSPFSVVYQGTVQHQQYQYRAPSSGPSRNRRKKGHRKTEVQYANRYLHELSGATARDHPTGIHPVYIWIGALDNPGAGGVWRPPSRNPSMVDRNSTRVTPYVRDRSTPSWARRKRRDSVDLSVYEILIEDSGSKNIDRSSVPAVTTAPAPAPAPHPSTSTTPSSQSTLSTSSEMFDEETTTNTNMQEQPVEDDDFDTISLGSDIDYQN